MQIGKRAALGGAVLAFAAMPVSTAMGAKKKAKITVRSVAAVPETVDQGASFALAGKVKAAKNRKPAAGRFKVELRTLTDRPAPALAVDRRIKRIRAGRVRRFERTVTVPGNVAEGLYLVRACAKRKNGGAYRCKIAKGRLRVTKAATPPGPPVIDTRNASQKLRTAVTAAGMRAHLEAFQRIGTLYGNRASGLLGYDASGEYVMDVLRKAGYRPQKQVFPFVLFEQDSPATLTRTDVEPDQSYTEDEDFGVFEYSGDTDETPVTNAVVEAVDIIPGLGNTATSGCQPADFDSFEAGKVALIQRGSCDFGVKAENAQAAGAVGVLIFNQGNTADPARNEPILTGTLGRVIDIPVFGISYDEGIALSTGTPTVSMDVSTTSTPLESFNITADTPEGNPNSVVVVGSHLDSVAEGPGINDNGTGSAFNLEAAVQMAKLGIKPTKTVRFAFWGAEEAGLVGSTYYVNTLSDGAFEKLSANLNFDMLGSPNIGKFVYDGDFSATTPPATAPDVNPGAAAIEKLFVDYFTSQGIPTEPSAFDGRSDYKAFQDNGIPAGGLFSGAEVSKTAAQAAKWGGTAGQAFDPCYHQACDTIDNVDFAGFEQMADGGAHVLATLATSPGNPGGGRAAEQRTRRSARWAARSERLGSHLQR